MSTFISLFRSAVAFIMSCLTVISGTYFCENEAPSLPPEDENAQYIYFDNKLADGASDPWVILKDGVYYYCYSANGGVCVAKADTLPEVGNTEGIKVWTPEDEKYSQNIWAPELHYLEGKWYIYVAADDGDNANHRMICLEGTSQDPTEPFIFKSVMRAKTDRWAIDGTVMEFGGKLYFVWSGWKGCTNLVQRLYIAKLENPWTVSGDRVEISCPTLLWEIRGGTPLVNEGPTALDINGKMHIIYSASGSWSDNYCLGMLTLDGDDPMVAGNWTKSLTPVFKKTKDVFGPGHASFTTSKDGSQYFIVYHANEESGSGWNGRSLWAQEFAVDENNDPVFGSPLPAGSMQKIKD